MASFFGMLLLLPVFIVVAILIKIKMPGPIFFKQQRVGKDAKLFRMVKFRTMKVNHGGSTISVKGESRITPLGQTLRKYKLDELPELWNIFKGDMSFVGPRPDVPGYADKLEGDDRLLLNEHVLYPEKVRLNNNYVKRMSFWLDIKIITFTLLGKKLKEEWAN